MVSEAIGRALKHVLSTLATLDVPIAIIGGIAVAAWKHLRTTKDIDLLVDLPTEACDEVLRKLAAANIRAKRDPPIFTLDQQSILQLLYEPEDTFLDIQIDLLLARTEFQRIALARRVATRLPGLEIETAVVACEDLIILKLLAGRIVDRADAAALLRANHDSLDLVHLRQWVQRLKLGTDLNEIWQEAFPV